MHVLAASFFISWSTATATATTAASPHVDERGSPLWRPTHPGGHLGGGGDGQQRELERSLDDNVAPHRPRQKRGVLWYGVAVPQSEYKEIERVHARKHRHMKDASTIQE